MSDEAWIDFEVQPKDWAEVVELYGRCLWPLPAGPQQLTFADACVLFFRMCCEYQDTFDTDNPIRMPDWVFDLEDAIFIYMADEFA